VRSAIVYLLILIVSGLKRNGSLRHTGPPTWMERYWSCCPFGWSSLRHVRKLILFISEEMVDIFVFVSQIVVPLG
jgi:hypothetical protein